MLSRAHDDTGAIARQRPANDADRRLVRLTAATFVASIVTTALAAADGAISAPHATLSFNGVDYVHRWSKAGQNEFTPRSDVDLTRWHDMVTINVHERVRDGDGLAAMANQVLGNYQSRGKIVRTDSRPRTPQRPAEHLVVALFGQPDFIEAAFSRFVLRDGVGVVAVYSHRVYGNNAGGEMGQWLEANGPRLEQALMAWDAIPSASRLAKLPQSR